MVVRFFAFPLSAKSTQVFVVVITADIFESVNVMTCLSLKMHRVKLQDTRCCELI